MNQKSLINLYNSMFDDTESEEEFKDSVKDSHEKLNIALSKTKDKAMFERFLCMFNENNFIHKNNNYLTWGELDAVTELPSRRNFFTSDIQGTSYFKDPFFTENFKFPAVDISNTYTIFKYLKNLKTIGLGSLSCINLNILYIPKTVTTFLSGYEKYYPPKSLLPKHGDILVSKIVVDKENKNYKSCCGSLCLLENKNDIKKIILCVYSGWRTNTIDLRIPNGVSEITCPLPINIRCLKIPGSMKKIPKYIFAEKNIKDLTICDGVEKIECFAFSGSTINGVIKFPKTLKVIEQFAFKNCREINTILIPDSVTDIRVGAFWGGLDLDLLVLPKIFRNTYFNFFNESSLPKNYDSDSPYFEVGNYIIFVSGFKENIPNINLLWEK